MRVKTGHTLKTVIKRVKKKPRSVDSDHACENRPHPEDGDHACENRPHPEDGDQECETKGHAV